MSENLFCGGQKVLTPQGRKNFERIFSNKEFEMPESAYAKFSHWELALLLKEEGFDPDKEIEVSRVNGSVVFKQI